MLADRYLALNVGPLAVELKRVVTRLEKLVEDFGDKSGNQKQEIRQMTCHFSRNGARDFQVNGASSRCGIWAQTGFKIASFFLPWQAPGNALRVRAWAAGSYRLPG